MAVSSSYITTSKVFVEVIGFLTAYGSYLVSGLSLCMVISNSITVKQNGRLLNVLIALYDVVFLNVIVRSGQTDKVDGMLNV